MKALGELLRYRFCGRLAGHTHHPPLCLVCSGASKLLEVLLEDLEDERGCSLPESGQ